MNKPGKIAAMISSTALDLPEHRKQVLEACIKAGVFPIGIEHLPARDVTGIRASLEMVDQADIYIGIYARRYGWVPDFDNPGKISITEIEFSRALERKESGDLKEILIFLAHDEHPVLSKDMEIDAVAQEKLTRLKERASAGRVCGMFKSPEDLHGKVFGNTKAQVLPLINKLTKLQIDEFVSTYNQTVELHGSFGFNGSWSSKYGPGLVYHLNRLGECKFRFAGPDKIESIT
jgi:hypothetical protein